MKTQSDDTKVTTQCDDSNWLHKLMTQSDGTKRWHKVMTKRDEKKWWHNVMTQVMIESDETNY